VSGLDGEPAAAKQLTISSKSAIFPFAAENGNAYATKLRLRLDVAALPYGGEIKEGLSPWALMQTREEPQSHGQALALRRALSALESASDEEKALVLLKFWKRLPTPP
jgi:hypothetical protein